MNGLWATSSPVGRQLKYSSPLMVYTGQNVISKNTEGFSTKLEPEVPPGIPLSSRSKLTELNEEPACPGEPREPRERGGSQMSRPAQVSHGSHVSGGGSQRSRAAQR